MTVATRVNRARLLGGTGLMAVLALSAGVARADNVTLITDLAGGCRAGGPTPGLGRISGPDLRKVLLKDNLVVLDWTSPAPMAPAGIVQDLVKTADDESWGDTSPNHTSYQAITLLVADWMGLTPDTPVLPLSQGGIRVDDGTGKPLSRSDIPAVLSQIFLGAGDRFTFVCGKPTPGPKTPEGQPAQAKTTLTIAKTVDDLGKGGSDTQKSGELGLIDDRTKNQTTFATDIAIGLAIPIFRPRADQPKDAFRGFEVSNANFTPFVSYDRAAGNDPTDKTYVNNLSFGLATNGMAIFRTAFDRSTTFSVNYALSARYETDDLFKSRAYVGQLTLQPILPLWANTSPEVLPIKGLPFELSAVWTLGGTADYHDVLYAWKKQALLKLHDFDRAGYDAMGALIYRPPLGGGGWSVRWENDYSDRDDVSGHKGSAYLWTSKLSLMLTQNYGLSAVYAKGKDLSSLATVDKWTITIDLKQ